MDLKLKNFLSTFVLKDNEINLFNDAKLNNATYITSLQKFIIDISFDSLCDPSLYFVIEKIKNDNTYNFNFNVIQHETLMNSDYLKEIFEKVILVKYKNVAMIQSIKNIEIETTNTRINFVFKSEMQRDSFLMYKKDFQKIYHTLGASKLLEFIVSKTETVDVKKEFEDEINQIIKKNTPAEQQSFKREIDPSKLQNRYYTHSEDEVELSTLSQNDKNVIVSGKVFALEEKEYNNKLIMIYCITDYNDSISVKCFENARLTREILKDIKVGTWIKVRGNVNYDNYEKEDILTANTIEKIEVDEKIIDTAEVKRVELHTHTKMSNMDGVVDASDYIKQALDWGHKAIAITDHGVVQAYPDANNASKGKDIKVIYGLEAYVIEEHSVHIMNPSNVELEGATYVSFDLETTGLSSRMEEIIEIGAIKMKNGMQEDSFQTFVNPGKPLSAFTTELTNITNDMVKDAPSLEEAISKFLEFSKGCILVAHNAIFDISFIKEAINKLGFTRLTNPIIDTLPLSRYLYSEHRSHTLGAISRRFNIEYDEEVAHRADYDAKVLANVFEVMLNEIVHNRGIKKHEDIEKLQDYDNLKKRPFHVNILVKNQDGVKDLYKIVSMSNVKYYNEVPLIPRKVLEEYRQNLLLGSACFKGEVFDIASTRNHEDLLETAKFYDFLEVQPLDNYSYLVDTGSVDGIDTLKKIINFIIDAGKELNIPVVATSDAHYVNPKQKIFRDVYITAQAIGGKHHPLYDYKKRVKENPNQHLRTTNEMLDAFDFLGKDLAYEIVVINSNNIADSIEKVIPLKDGTYSPRIENDKEELTRICWETAHKLYGENIPDIVQKRVEKELNSIIGNGFAVMYYIAHKLVKKSNDDGYIVGSRGSVGSSLVAHFTGITEVNALPPHYICDNCKHCEFDELPDGIYSGYDLPEKICPECGTIMRGEGHNIPFETFLGFKGDKVPDIDLNFSGDYQPKAHDYTKVLFGEDNVYRAGTIGTVAEKTAYGYVKGYFEELGKENQIRKAEMKRIAMGCEGIKRTTGQHPGGIIVIPNYMDVYDFTPIQYPADSLDANWKTTHFDFHAIHDNVLKLDILGHVDPTALRMLFDITGINPKDLDCSDKKVISLFTSCEALGVTKEDILNENGVVGIPEFGTNFVRKMVLECQPTSFAELVQISGLSHGTDVWNNNAQELINNKTCKLMNVIGCRDDIMVELIKMGLDPSMSFKIMESVRKGKGLSPEFEEAMISNNVPDWYIASCKKIKYMFPKAHAVAYVTMAMRVAWYKVYRPLEYYAVYFTTRCDAYDIETMIQGKEAIKAKFLDIQARKANYTTAREVTNKEESLLTTLESAIEMTARGYKFSNIDLYRSDSKNFIVDHETKSLIPPFSAIDGLGEAAAKTVIEARKNGEFLSIEDLTVRTQLNGTNIKMLEKLGVLKDMQAKNQLELDLF